MQKLITSFSLLTLTFTFVVLPMQSISEELPQRKVLLELFTGTWCGWCPYGAEIAEKLRKQYDNLIVVTYHSRDEMEIEESKQLIELIRPGYPQAAIDRTLFENEKSIALGRDLWESRILEQSNTQSPISIELSGSYEPDTKTVSIGAVICSYEDMYAELRVNVIVTEDSLNFKQKIYDKPFKEIDPYYHMHVVRDMVTGTFGEPLNDKPLKKQLCMKKNFTFTLKENCIPENCHIVVFVHENERVGFGRVHQAASIAVDELR